MLGVPCAPLIGSRCSARLRGPLPPRSPLRAARPPLRRPRLLRARAPARRRRRRPRRRRARPRRPPRPLLRRSLGRGPPRILVQWHVRRAVGVCVADRVRRRRPPPHGAAAAATRGVHRGSGRRRAPRLRRRIRAERRPRPPRRRRRVSPGARGVRPALALVARGGGGRPRRLLHLGPSPRAPRPTRRRPLADAAPRALPVALLLLGHLGAREAAARALGPRGPLRVAPAPRRRLVAADEPSSLDRGAHTPPEGGARRARRLRRRPRAQGRRRLIEQRLFINKRLKSHAHTSHVRSAPCLSVAHHPSQYEGLPFSIVASSPTVPSFLSLRDGFGRVLGSGT